MQVLYDIVAIEGYFKFERVYTLFSVKLIISFSGCYSFLNRYCLDK
jgi:hypothetical protein